MLPKSLLKVLACTKCSKNLRLVKKELVCTGCGKIFEVIDGVPKMF